MKSKPFLNKLALLATTMMFAPAVATAQTAETPPAEPANDPPAAEASADAPLDATADDEVVVLGRFIPEPMRQTSEVVSVLSAEDLARTGDDNAAIALTRLSGLSVVSGRFVFVRGLGDRYSSALLNGSPLPSPEPLRRQVPLDLFPSNILDGATVQKTFSANYPGEFGGGIIDLRTLRMPNEPFLTIKTGASGNTETTDKRGLTYYGERSDWTGIGDGLRDIPPALQAAINARTRIQDSNFSPAQLETIGESLVNSPLTVIQSVGVDPNGEGEVTAGASYDIGKFNLGLVGVGAYSNSWRTERAERTNVGGNSIITDGTSVDTTQNIVGNAFGSVTLGWDDNEISLTGLLVRSTSKSAQFQDNTNVNVDPLGNTTLHKESTAWYERQIASLQLAGEHSIDRLDVNWRGAFAQSTRDAPYERDITYSVTNGQPLYSRDNQNATRFSYLKDEVLSGGIDAEYTLPLSEQRDAVFSAGYAYSNTVRTYDLFSFVFTGPATATPNNVLGARPDFLFSPDNIDPLRFEIAEFTGRDDAYKGLLTTNAFYGAADVEILPLIRASLGVRYEDATQRVRTGNRFGEVPFARPIEIANSYVLPAATVTWNFAEDLQLRVGYSQSIARPQFRELAFTPYIDPETDRVYQGNGSLTDSEFQNYDARLEYYFGRNQFITAAGFYKQIDKPIEEVIVSGDGGNTTITNFINAPEAELYGIELEYRTRFELPFELPLLTGAEWLFGVNYTYTHSEIKAGPGATVIDPTDPTNPVARPASVFGLDGSELQGTPENIANVQFGFETEHQQLTLIAGWVDTRIARRGLGSLPTVMEDPGVNVDLVYRFNFAMGGTDFTLGLAGRNLLDERHEEFQMSSLLGRTEANTFDRGQSYSVSLAAKF
jgi:TonB-dependent receptor